MPFFQLLFQIIISILQLLLLLFWPASWPIHQFQELMALPSVELPLLAGSATNQLQELLTPPTAKLTPLTGLATYQLQKLLAPSSIELTTLARFATNLFAPQVFAATTKPELLFADDFSQGFDQWQLARGSWSHWLINQDGWLEVQLNSAQTVSILVPKDDCWQESWLDYQLEFDFEVLSQADVNFSWGFEDLNNWYEVHFYDDFFHLIRLKDGEVVYSHSGEFALPRFVQHRAYVVFNQGKIQVWIDDELVVDRFDITYEDNGGKIALRATTGAAFPTRVRFNNLKVFSYPVVEGVKLPLTKFKQSQSPWADDEYNHALSWRRWGNWQELQPPQPPTRVLMRHWGCALTSLAMILNYHGLSFLPDDQPLTPGTLNAWLKKQPDGFIGEGSLNWLAGSRLSRLISDHLSTAWYVLPKLEFVRSFTSDLSQVKEIIDQDRPAILQIPGHFLVAHGHLPAPELELGFDLYIADPDYNHLRFSQHRQSLVSLLDYQPSQTDLSYLMLVYDPSLQLTIFNSELQIVTESFFAQDTIAQSFYDHEECLLTSQNPLECGANLHSPIIQYLPQPQDGEYFIQATKIDGELSSSDGLSNSELISNKDGVSNSELSNSKLVSNGELISKDKLIHNGEVMTNTGLPAQLIHSWQLLAYDTAGEVRLVDRFLAAQEELVQLEFVKQDLSQLTIQGLTEPNFELFKMVLQDLVEHDFTQVNAYLYFRLLEIAQWSPTSTNSWQQDRYLQLVLSLLAHHENLMSSFAHSQLISALIEM